VKHLAHWDDVEPIRREAGHLAGSWRDLGTAAGTWSVGLQRIEVDPGKWATPAHAELVEEEIFYVLGGSGLAWMDGQGYEIGAGDCMVYLAAEEAHTHQAGPEGLDLLAFGMRSYHAGTLLPRAGMVRLDPAWLEASGDTRHPWEREAAAGEPPVGKISPRPKNIVHVSKATRLDVRASIDRDLGRSGGSERTGLCHVEVAAGKQGAPHHCHSAEEEIFVMLTGSAVLELIPGPRLRLEGGETERHELRPGHLVARPGGTRVSHHIVGGPEGGTMLVYGTKDPNDIAYYPHSNKINFRGVGLIARLDALEYADGETEFGG
jgi:uncharacterized cupin superfamily protein